MMAMTATCWWASYTREGFMPQMFGSIRACCAATTELEDFREEGIQWGDRKCFILTCGQMSFNFCLTATCLGWFWTQLFTPLL